MGFGSLTQPTLPQGWHCWGVMGNGTFSTIIVSREKRDTSKGVLSFFSSYAGLDPASTVYHKKNLEYQAYLKKNFEILAT